MFKWFWTIISLGAPGCSENRGFARTVDCFLYLNIYLFRLLVSTLKALSIFPQPCPQPRHLALCKIAFWRMIGIVVQKLDGAKLSFSWDEWFEIQYCQMPTVLSKVCRIPYVLGNRFYTDFTECNSHFYISLWINAYRVYLTMLTGK